jgi:hypothetical protein
MQNGEVEAKSDALIQSPHDLIELIEVAVADVHGAAGIAVIDIDREAERVADALFQRDRVGVFGLAATRLLGFANRNTLAAGSGTPISARAWPADSLPDAM